MALRPLVPTVHCRVLQASASSITSALASVFITFFGVVIALILSFTLTTVLVGREEAK